MAEVKRIEVSGDELERRIRVQLEFSIRDAEEMLNKELVKSIADDLAKHWVKENKKKFNISVDEIGKQVTQAIVAKAVFNLAIELAERPA